MTRNIFDNNVKPTSTVTVVTVILVNLNFVYEYPEDMSIDITNEIASATNICLSVINYKI